MRTTRGARSVTRWASFGSVMLIAALTAKAADLPAGWFAAGSRPAEYQMGIDTTVTPRRESQRVHQGERERIARVWHAHADGRPW